jgi:hypothetical protein
LLQGPATLKYRITHSTYRFISTKVWKNIGADESFFFCNSLTSRYKELRQPQGKKHSPTNKNKGVKYENKNKSNFRITQFIGAKSFFCAMGGLYEF